MSLHRAYGHACFYLHREKIVLTQFYFLSDHGVMGNLRTDGLVDRGPTNGYFAD